MGHALNKVLKDIVNRYKLLKGFRINYTPGFDCHGLPLELKAIQHLEPCSGSIEYTPSQVRHAARQTAQAGVAQQIQEFSRLAILADWKNAWLTMDHGYEIRQLEIFSQMVKNQLVFRRRKPVHFSPSSRTALAEAEIEYRDDHVSKSVYVAFDVVHMSPALRQVAEQSAPGRKLKLIVWTTTPWTLAANQAVAVGSTAHYSLVEFSGGGSSAQETYIFATQRLQVLSQLLPGAGQLEVVGQVTGEELRSSRYRSGLSSTDLPIFTADHVTADSGSGLVHIAPSHGLDDFHAFKSNLTEKATGTSSELLDVVDDLGRFKLEGCEDWKNRLLGKAVLQEGNDEMIRLLKAGGMLVGNEIKVRHKYPYDWRTKQPIITKLTEQWFVELKELRHRALSAIEHVKFIPPSSRARLESFLHSRSEWCISRQRPWGVPIPVLYSVDTAQQLLNPESVRWIVEILREKGVQHWWDGPLEDFLPPGVLGKYERGRDTMDVWLDSGVSWSILDGMPADMVLEGSDQHRGWFQSLLLTSLASETSPKDHRVYRSVVTHGFTLDKHGRKMSKSLGNVISPLEIIDGNSVKKQTPFGTDVLRLWAASVDFTKDVVLGLDQISRLSDVARKFRSSARFLLGNIRHAGANNIAHVEADLRLGLIEKYMLHCLYEFDAEIQAAYRCMDFKQVVQIITRFTTRTLSGFYFEVSKDVLYNDARNSAERRGILFVMTEVLEVYRCALAPILPLLAEEIWMHQQAQELQLGVSVELKSTFQKCWPVAKVEWQDQLSYINMTLLLSLRSCLLAELEVLRQKRQLKTSEENKLVIDLTSFRRKSLQKVATLLDEAKSLPRLLGLSDVLVCQDFKNTESLGVTSSWKHEFEWKPGADLLPVKLIIMPATKSKCPRCWNYTVEEGSETCPRCTEVLADKLNYSLWL